MCGTVEHTLAHNRVFKYVYSNKDLLSIQIFGYPSHLSDHHPGRQGSWIPRLASPSAAAWGGAGSALGPVEMVAAVRLQYYLIRIFGLSRDALRSKSDHRTAKGPYSSPQWHRAVGLWNWGHHGLGLEAHVAKSSEQPLNLNAYLCALRALCQVEGVHMVLGCGLFRRG